MKNRTASIITGLLCASLIFGGAGFAAHTAYAADASDTSSTSSTSETAAEENVFTTENGVLSIKLPAEDWKEITDPTRWVVLSNGVDVITIDHFSNGEKLPDVNVADSHYTNVYEAIYSTQNEVFLITGFVANEDSITEVCNAIMSVKVLKYNTKQAVKKVAVEAKQFTIREINKTYYVTSDGVNVRSGCSVSDPIIGGLNKGNAVNVRGAVQYNGADYGWYQIDFGQGTGYVAADFLSETAPAAPAAPVNDIIYTGRVVTIYDAAGTAITVNEANDGYWYDRNGTKYLEVGDGSVYVIYGNENESFSIYNPANNSSYTGASVTIYDANDYAITIYEMTDGTWWDNNGNKYTHGDGMNFYGPGGELYTANGSIFDPTMGAPEETTEYDDTNYEEYVDPEAGVEDLAE